MASSLLTPVVLSSHHGLLIGLASERTCLYLVPTPNNPNESASGAPKILDKDWIVEHAFQVSRMLTGNLEILGAFVVAEDLNVAAQFTNQLHSIVKSIVAQRKAAGARQLQDQRHYILLVSKNDKQFRVLESDVKQKAEQLPKEADLKSPSQEIHSLETRVFVDIEIPLRSGLRLSLRDQIKRGLQLTEANLTSAMATINNTLVSGAAQQLSSFTGQYHSVELYCDVFPSAAAVDAADGNSIIESVIRYSGSISARAYCLASQSAAAAVEFLKADVIESLRIRVEALTEEYAVSKKGPNLDASSLDDAKLRSKEEKWVLHRRVYIPLVQPVMLSDYLAPEETLQDCEARCVDLLALKPPPGSIENWLVPGESLFAVPNPSKVSNPVPTAAEKGAKVKQELQAKMASLEKASPTIPTRIYAFISLSVLIAVAALYFQSWLVANYKAE